MACSRRSQPSTLDRLWSPGILPLPALPTLLHIEILQKSRLLQHSRPDGSPKQQRGGEMWESSSRDAEWTFRCELSSTAGECVLAGVMTDMLEDLSNCGRIFHFLKVQITHSFSLVFFEHQINEVHTGRVRSARNVCNVRQWSRRSVILCFSNVWTKKRRH